MYFEELILSLDDDFFEYLFREVSWATVKISIFRESAAVQEKVFRNMSQRRANIVKSMPNSYPQENEYLQAQGEIVQAILYFNKHKYLTLTDTLFQGAKTFLDEVAAKKEEAENRETIHFEAKKVDIQTEIFQRVEEAVNSDGKVNLAGLGNFHEEPDMAELERAFCLLKETPLDLYRIKKLTISISYLKFAEPLFKPNALETLVLSAWQKPQLELSDVILLCSNLKNLEINAHDGMLPAWLQQFRELVSLNINYCNMTGFPDWICGLDSLQELTVKSVNLTYLPETIERLSNLAVLDLDYNSKLKTLPDSIGQLSKLKNLDLSYSGIECLPESLGNLSALENLNLNGTFISSLPDSFANLSSLRKVSLQDTQLAKIPPAMIKLSSLEELNLYGTPINRQNIPSEMLNNKNINISLSYFLIPDKEPFLYEDFVISYKRIVGTSYLMAKKAMREGLLALEEDMEYLMDGEYLKTALRLVVDGTGPEEIRPILTNLIDGEKDHYRRILKNMLLEAALSIQSGEDSVKIVLMLHSMADIPENPVTSAIEDYLRTGDKNIFELALEKLSKEEFYFVSKSESYEIERFLDWALKACDTARRYGLEGAAEMITKSNEPLDMFDYGILMAADGYETVFIEKILNNYSVLETEPAFQTLAKMKKSAVLSIVQGDNPRILVLKLYSLYMGAIRNDRCPHLRD